MTCDILSLLAVRVPMQLDADRAVSRARLQIHFQVECRVSGTGE